MQQTRRSGYRKEAGILKAAVEGRLAVRRGGDGQHRLLATTALGSALLMAPVGAAVVIPGAAWANPAGGVVVGGEAAIHHAPGVTTIDQASQSAIINWQQFSIAPGELTQFRQPDTGAIALNRVVGSDASEIMGALKANGQVWLINPNGILFGPNARIDVHGILATTTDIADRDFMAGRYDFNRPSPNPAAAVVNQGTISIGEKGLGALVAPHVRNDGVIAGKLSQVVLAGAETFTLDFYGDGLVQFATTSEVKEALKEHGALVSNDGTISADGGSVLITAAAASDVVDEVINVSGVVEAKSVAMKDGAIILDGGDNGIVHLAGTLDASGPGAGEKGGALKVLGKKVAVADGARIDVSGDAGGGEVLIGGNYQGKGPERNADRTVVFKKARVKADGLRDGDGGRVIVWSDDATRFDGTISARGGAEGGDGGFVEVSGLNKLDFRGSADRTAPNGEAGMLLLDPNNITIGAGGDPEFPDISIAGAGTPADPFTSTNDSAFLSVGTLQSALATGSVTVRTGSAGENSEEGDITINAAIDAPDGSGNLILEADDDIFVNAIVDFSGTPGGVTFDAGASVLIGANVNTSGGSINISSRGGNGLTISGATVDAGGGDIILAGANLLGGSGVSLLADESRGPSGVQTSASGAISLNGVGAGGEGAGLGIIVRDGSFIQSRDGDITMRGTGGDGASNADGILVFNGGTIEVTGAGNISLVGDAGSGDIDNQGIAIGRSGGGLISRVAVSTGNVTAVGTGNGTGSDPGVGNFGVWVFDGGVIEVIGTGTISIQGTGASNDPGIVAATNVFQSGSSTISSGDAGTSLTLTADEIDLAGGARIEGSGILQLQPLTPDLPILVGSSEDSGVGVLDVTTADLSSLIEGFASITIGRDNGFGALTVAAAGVTFNDPVVLRSPGIGGSIVVNGPMQTNGKALTLRAGSTADINAILDAYGADITVTSGGTIDTTGSLLVSLPWSDAGGANELDRERGPGGDITLAAAGDIITGGLVVSAGNSGGNVSLTSDNGSITLGVIESGIVREGSGGDWNDSGGPGGDAGGVGLYSTPYGGNISIQAAQSIATNGIFPVGVVRNGNIRVVSLSGEVTINGNIGENSVIPSFGGDIIIEAEGGISTKNLRASGNSGAGNITITSAGGVVDTTAGTMTANSTQGVAGVITIASADTIAVGPLEASGSISLDSGGADVTLNGPVIGGSFNASAGNNVVINIADDAEEPAVGADTHTITAGGQILNPGGGSLFSGLISLTAGSGIGTAEQAIFTDGQTTLRADVTGPVGGIFVQHQSAAETLVVDSASSPGSDVNIRTLSDIIISGPISAGGAAVDLFVSNRGGITANAPITAANGNVFIGAEGNVTVNADIQAGDEINIDAQNVTQALSAALIADQLFVLAGPEVNLNGLNQVNRAAGRAAGTFEFRNTKDLVVDTPDSESPWSFIAEEITLQIEGVLTVREPIITSGLDTIVLNTQGFVNAFEGEGQALDPGPGRFLVYSTRRPSEDDRGNLDGISDIIRGTFTDNPPESITPAAENFFIYPDFGTLTFTAIDRPVEYGDLFVLPDPPLQDVDYTVRFFGGERDELPANPFSGEPALTSNPVVDEAGLLGGVGEFPIVIGPGSLASDFSLEFVNSRLEVRPAPLTGSPVARREYGEANSTAAFDPASFSGFKGDDGFDDLGAIAFTTSAGPASPVAGSPYSLNVTGIANDNYSVAGLQPGEFRLTPGPLTIQADDASRPFAAPNPAFTATFTGFKLGEGPEVVTGLQFSTLAEPSSPRGDYPIVPFGATAPNYSISFADGTLTIEDIAPDDIPNSALSGTAISSLSLLGSGPEGGDSAGEAGDAGGITGLNVAFGMPETGALTEDEELLFSSGGNESFWGPSVAP